MGGRPCAPDTPPVRLAPRPPARAWAAGPPTRCLVAAPRSLLEVPQSVLLNLLLLQVLTAMLRGTARCTPLGTRVRPPALASAEAQAASACYAHGLPKLLRPSCQLLLRVAPSSKGSCTEPASPSAGGFPMDGIGASYFLAAYMSEELRAESTLGAILTLVDLAGRWVPWTLATERPSLPGEWALFLVSQLEGGGIVGSMRDASVLGTFTAGSRKHQVAKQAAAAASNFVFEMKAAGSRVTLRDGATSRPGGPRCANDARGLGLHTNAIFYGNGNLCLRPFAAVLPLRADMTLSQRRCAEIVWSYDGPTPGHYWPLPPRHRDAAGAGCRTRRRRPSRRAPLRRGMPIVRPRPLRGHCPP